VFQRCNVSAQVGETAFADKAVRLASAGGNLTIVPNRVGCVWAGHRPCELPVFGKALCDKALSGHNTFATRRERQRMCEPRKLSHPRA